MFAPCRVFKINSQRPASNNYWPLLRAIYRFEGMASNHPVDFHLTYLPNFYFAPSLLSLAFLDFLWVNLEN